MSIYFFFAECCSAAEDETCNSVAVKSQQVDQFLKCTDFQTNRSVIKEVTEGNHSNAFSRSKESIETTNAHKVASTSSNSCTNPHTNSKKMACIQCKLDTRFQSNVSNQISLLNESSTHSFKWQYLNSASTNYSKYKDKEESISLIKNNKYANNGFPIINKYNNSIVKETSTIDTFISLPIAKNLQYSSNKFTAKHIKDSLTNILDNVATNSNHYEETHNVSVKSSHFHSSSTSSVQSGQSICNTTSSTFTSPALARAFFSIKSPKPDSRSKTILSGAINESKTQLSCNLVISHNNSLKSSCRNSLCCNTDGSQIPSKAFCDTHVTTQVSETPTLSRNSSDQQTWTIMCEDALINRNSCNYRSSKLVPLSTTTLDQSDVVNNSLKKSEQHKEDYDLHDEDFLNNLPVATSEISRIHQISPVVGSLVCLFFSCNGILYTDLILLGIFLSSYSLGLNTLLSNLLMLIILI